MPSIHQLDLVPYPSWLITAGIGIIGLVIGSFLNVCILRWPKNESVIFPRSRCGSCQQPIAWYLNVPVFSFLWLRGQSACCQKKISLQYLIVEVLTSCVFMALWVSFPHGLAMVGMVFFAILWVGSSIDFRHFMIPYPVLSLGFFSGLIASFFIPELHQQTHALPGFLQSLKALGLATGGLFWFTIFTEIIFKKPTLGLGDSLWLGIIASFTGLLGALIALGLGSMLGCLYIGLSLAIEKCTGWSICPRINPENLDLAHNQQQQPPIQLHVAVPFGPWLGLAGFLYFLAQHIPGCIPFLPHIKL